MGKASGRWGIYGSPFLLILGCWSFQVQAMVSTFDPSRELLGGSVGRNQWTRPSAGGGSVPTLFAPELLKMGQLGTRSLFYLNEGYQNAEARGVQLFEGRIVRSAEEAEFSLGVDLEGQFSADQPWFNNFTAHEFYFRTDPEWSGATLYLGRKRSRWSALDEQWRLGVWQPIYRVDPLIPESQGLTGLFVAFKQENWVLEFFGTPFYLPDHGPQMETHNGAFVKGHPWVQYPPSQILIRGVPTRAYYQIDRPSIPDIIVNKGYGVNFQWGDGEAEGLATRVAWAYKPMNQLLLGFDYVLNTSSEREGLEIDIHPEVGFHEVTSLDAVYKGKDWSVYGGLISDSPRESSFEDRWTSQAFTSSLLAGAGAEFRKGFWRWGVAYIHREGGDSVVSGPRASVIENALPERFLFQDLAKAEVSYSRRLKGPWAYQLAASLRQELREKSEMLSIQGALSMGSYWKAFLGLDWLATENQVPGRVDFIESYQTNDRVYGGIQYVF